MSTVHWRLADQSTSQMSWIRPFIQQHSIIKSYSGWLGCDRPRNLCRLGFSNGIFLFSTIAGRVVRNLKETRFDCTNSLAQLAKPRDCRRTMTWREDPSLKIQIISDFYLIIFHTATTFMISQTPQDSRIVVVLERQQQKKTVRGLRANIYALYNTNLDRKLCSVWVNRRLRRFYGGVVACFPSK